MFHTKMKDRQQKLYGGNIEGAVFGCLLAGFYPLRVHDTATATYVAAALNGVVALDGFVLAGSTKHSTRRKPGCAC